MVLGEIQFFFKQSSYNLKAQQFKWWLICFLIFIIQLVVQKVPGLSLPAALSQRCHVLPQNSTPSLHLQHGGLLISFPNIFPSHTNGGQSYFPFR